MAKFELEKVSNISQLGGIEVSVLDNGPARGSRIAWFNTGGGVRYKVAIDKACDIVDAFYNQHSLSFVTHAGLTNPRPDADHGIEWLYTFAGGLVTTCGLTHFGPPEDDEYGKRGIHGRVSNLSAEVESVIQPDPANGKLEMSLTALITETSLFGPTVQLRRTISSTLGQANIKIHDEVTNQSNSDSPHMLLYHCNFGFPLVDEGADIVYKGKCKSRGMDQDNQLFNEKHDYRKCQPVLDIHNGFGEACGFIEAEPDVDGVCTVGIANTELGMALMMKYEKKQMPSLTNWQHWGRGEYVCAIEPGTNNPIGQSVARKEGSLIMLKPGEKRQYDLEFSVVTNSDDIKNFITTAG